MDERAERIDVERREEGILLTFHCQNGKVVEWYLSQKEAKAIQRQLDEQIDEHLSR